MPLFEAASHIFLYNKYLKMAENTLPELLLIFYSIGPQMSNIHWFDFFFKQKRYNYAWYNNVLLKLKEKMFTKAIYFIYN